MMPVDKARRALDDAINGDVDEVDKPTLRAVHVLATEIDDLRSEIVKLDVRISSFTKALYTLATSIGVAVISTAIMLALKQQ